jgi:ubiquinone/menaquinone biosynthesis C-methylase UbiE
MKTKHVCPWWLGYLLASPFRRFGQDPHQILAPHVVEGMTVLEPGPGMGFFTLELARLVGPKGRVIAIDIQPKMLNALARRAKKVHLESRIELRQPEANRMCANDIQGRVDFVLAFAVVHELPDAEVFFGEMYRVLKPEGQMLLVSRQNKWDTFVVETSCRSVSAPASPWCLF